MTNLSCPQKSILLAALFVFGGVSGLPAQDKPAAPASEAKPAQEPAPPTQQKGPAPIRVISDVVVVPVTVKDRSGNLVGGLERDDFRVFEDNVEQQITRLTYDVVPLSIVVLIDNDLRRKDAQQVEPSLTSILQGLSTSDETFVCRFDQFFHEGKGFSRDQDKVLAELKRTELDSRPSAPPPGGPFEGPTINNAPAPGAPSNPAGLQAIKGQPTKALDDAIFNAAMLLKDRDSRKRRKVILLISDGQNGAKFNTHSYDETRTELLRQGIQVYSIATGSSYFERKFSRLVSYSKDTGGDIYFGASQKAFSDFYSRITEEARNQYVLTYSPQGDRKVDYHTIEVRVRRDGLTILAREGYYGGTFAESR